MQGDSKGSLINRALLLLGSEQIASLDDGTDKSATVSGLYDTTILTLLTRRTWRFTMEKKALTRLAQAPINGYKYAYQLPTTQTAGPWVVYNSDRPGARPQKEFEIYGDQLLTDYETVIVDFQVETKPDRWPAYFSNLAVHALAAAFAVPITESEGLFDKYHLITFGPPIDQQQGGLFRVAAQADAKGSPSDQLDTDELVATRMS